MTLDTTRSAEEVMRRELHPAVFNHSMRVLHLARHLAVEGPALDLEALSVTALFHDSGTTAVNNGPDRFEVEGADAAARFLDARAWPQDRIRPVWEAIVLHTSPGIAERFGPLARVLRTAVLVDLGRTTLTVPATPTLQADLDGYPRMEIDRVLPALVVAQALEGDVAAKAPPFSWPGALVAEHLGDDGTS